MRTSILLSGLAAALALDACSWSQFDDLSKETWVDSTNKPDVKSSDYGVSIQRGGDASESSSGGTLAVIGAGPGSYSELAYSPTGSSSLKTNSLQLAAQGIMALDSPPILLASPKSAEVALVTTGDNASIVVATGVHTLLVRQLFVGNSNTTLGAGVSFSTTPDAATYMQPLPFPGADPNPGPAPLVAVGDVVLGTIYSPPQNAKQPACRLVAGGSLQIKALGPVSHAGGASDDFLVWNGIDGSLLRYDGAAFNGCTTDPDALSVPTQKTTAATKPAFTNPGRGSQILPIGDGTRVLLQGQQDPTKGTGGFLQVYDVATLSPLGMAISAEGVRSATVLTTSTGTYAVAGFPNALIGGTTAGQIMVYKIADGGGIDSATPVAVLHDAQPETNQAFGRSVVAMPYNGTQVLAVAADNEIFVYFRANLSDGSPLLDETRQGK